MPLNDIIGRVIDLCDIAGSIDTHRAVETAMPLVTGDDEARDQLLREALGKRIKDAATKLRRNAESEDRQESFFGDRLRRRYALDIDGRVIKETNSLTRFEFERLIAIREKQLASDMAQLVALREARNALAPFWDANPVLTYGEAEQLFLRGRAAA